LKRSPQSRWWNSARRGPSYQQECSRKRSTGQPESCFDIAAPPSRAASRDMCVGKSGSTAILVPGRQALLHLVRLCLQFSRCQNESATICAAITLGCRSDTPGQDILQSVQTACYITSLHSLFSAVLRRALLAPLPRLVLHRLGALHVGREPEALTRFAMQEVIRRLGFMLLLLAVSCL